MKENENVWKTEDGREIIVKDMTSRHIESTLGMLKIKGFIDPSVFDFYLGCTLPTADEASMAFEQEFDDILNSPISVFIGIFERELERRKNEDVKARMAI